MHDIGINVSTEELVRQVEEYNPHILALSALLTTTMVEIGSVIRALEKRGIREGVKILVGGAPVNARFALEIGADAYMPRTRGKP